MKTGSSLAAALIALAGAAVLGAAPAAGGESGSCPTTAPASTPQVGAGAARFNHGRGRLRVHLTWRRGTLAAGILPDGGSIATVADDGSIHAKLGWWRGAPGRLTIAGHRLDTRAPALRAHVPAGYGRLGFQPSGLVFPTVGCWRVVGTVGGASVAFVVRVTRLPWH